MDSIRIETTLDGSNTIYVPSLDEHYHSVHGAVQESTHVYINTGLAACEINLINVLEIGFGTGLNAYLTLLYAKQFHKKINYTALELYPLSLNTIEHLNYTQGKGFDSATFSELHSSAWEEKIEITPDFFLTKHKCDLTSLNFSFDKTFDLIYYDAFAPDKQPEMWTEDIFDFLYNCTTPNGILTTYCAKGVIRRMLQKAGYKIERLPGPPGKREIIRAIKL